MTTTLNLTASRLTVDPEAGLLTSEPMRLQGIGLALLCAVPGVVSPLVVFLKPERYRLTWYGGFIAIIFLVAALSLLVWAVSPKHRRWVLDWRHRTFTRAGKTQSLEGAKIDDEPHAMGIGEARVEAHRVELAFAEGGTVELLDVVAEQHPLALAVVRGVTAGLGGDRSAGVLIAQAMEQVPRQRREIVKLVAIIFACEAFYLWWFLR